MKLFYLILFFTAGFFNTSNFNFKNENMTDAEIERFNYQLNEVKEVIDAGPQYNKKIAFLVDMRIKSGKNRFFVYDLVNNKILDQGLVAHGSGSETGVRGELKFSNTPNSNCTSLGRYSVEK